jgi:hypothetical protein
VSMPPHIVSMDFAVDEMTALRGKLSLYRSL